MVMRTQQDLWEIGCQLLIPGLGSSGESFTIFL